MASVLNRTTREYRRSVNTPDYPIQDWIIDPDLSAVQGVQSIYWVITGDEVMEMSQAEKDAVDAQELADLYDKLADTLEQSDSYDRAIALTLLDGVNNLSGKITGILNAIDNATNLASLKSAIAAITDAPQRTPAELKAALRARLET